jgi:hypothetical protein
MDHLSHPSAEKKSPKDASGLIWVTSTRVSHFDFTVIIPVVQYGVIGITKGIPIFVEDAQFKLPKSAIF